MPLSLVLLSLISTQADAAKIKITEVDAKSYYSRGEDVYESRYVKDSWRKPWFEGDRGNGMGAWIEVKFDEQTVSRVVVLPGDWTTTTSWKQANRPKELLVTFSDESTETWTLVDEMRPQTFKPAKPIKTNSIRLTYTQIFPGTAFPDTAITEIQVFNDQPGGIATREVLASSEFEADNESEYSPIMAADGIKDTYWCEGNKETDGVAEWIEFKFNGPQKLGKVTICTGICKFGPDHKNAAAPTGVTISFSDESSQKVTLEDTIKPKPHPLKPVTTEWARITLDTVRAGSSYNDACISEVAFD